MLPGDVLADLNRTITRNMLPGDVLADLNRTITRNMLAPDVLDDLNATIGSGAVTVAQLDPNLVKYFLPQISSHPAGGTILKGTDATLSTSATGQFLTYQWKKDGVDLPNETNPALVLTDVNATLDGNYTLTVSNDWGSVTSNAATFTVATALPAITLLGTASVTHEAATSYTDAGATALDTLDGNLTASIVVLGYNFNTTVLGDHNVTYNVVDAGGNAAAEIVRTVTVVDTILPVVTLLGDANVSHAKDTAWVDPGAAASDTLDGNLSGQVAISGTMDVNTTGTYVLTYNVFDQAGNAASPVTRTVNVAEPPSGPWNFTNAGVTGRTGPTQNQVNTAYPGGSLAGNVTINTQGIQEWTVPATGVYRLEALGAQGGDSPPWSSNPARSGGLGTEIVGNFDLNAGETITVVVGQKGEDGVNSNGSTGGGGGGGSGVAVTRQGTIVLLVLAGGGGGSGHSNDGLPGLISTGGGAGSGGGQGGTDGGQGGNTTSNYSYGGHGFNNGIGAVHNGGHRQGGFGFSSGGGAGEVTPHGGGGGGGYSGGGAGWNAGAGGGGSYNAGTSQSNTAGANAGHGKVTITFVGN